MPATAPSPNLQPSTSTATAKAGPSSHMLVLVLGIILGILIAGGAYYLLTFQSNPLLHSILANKGEIPLASVSNIIYQSVAKTGTINITYVGNLNISAKTGITTTTLNFPYNLSYQRSGPNSRLYFATSLSSSAGLGTLRPPLSNLTDPKLSSASPGSVTTSVVINATIIRSAQGEYICSNLFNLYALYSSSQSSGVECINNQTMQLAQNASNSQYATTYSETSLKNESSSLFKNSKLNLTVTSVSIASYKSLPCTMVKGAIVGRVPVNYSSPLNSVFSDVGQYSYYNYTVNVNGTYSACLSKENGYLPLSLSFKMNMQHGANNTIFSGTMNETAIGPIGSATSITKLPGKQLNLSQVLVSYCYASYSYSSYNNTLDQVSCSNPVMKITGAMRADENLSTYLYNTNQQILGTACNATNSTYHFASGPKTPSASNFLPMNVSLKQGYQNITMYFDCPVPKNAKLGSYYAVNTWALVQTGSSAGAYNSIQSLGNADIYVTTAQPIGKPSNTGQVPREIALPTSAYLPGVTSSQIDGISYSYTSYGPSWGSSGQRSASVIFPNNDTNLFCSGSTYHPNNYASFSNLNSISGFNDSFAGEQSASSFGNNACTVYTYTSGGGETAVSGVGFNFTNKPIQWETYRANSTGTSMSLPYRVYSYDNFELINGACGGESVSVNQSRCKISPIPPGCNVLTDANDTNLATYSLLCTQSAGNYTLIVTSQSNHGFAATASTFQLNA